MSRPKPNSKVIWLLILVVGLVISAGVIRSAGRRVARNAGRTTNADAESRLSPLPHIILWAWERPETLNFIDTDKVGVAFLAKTIYLRDERVVARPRLQPLSVRPGTVLMAVARIESGRSSAPFLTPNQRDAVAKEIAALAQLPNVAAVQVDFDAKVSERAFYADLLSAVRKALPLRTALSITALASWCKGDNWLDSLPIDEAVPMLFRMGVDRSQIVSGLVSGERFSSALCGQSSGVATDEPLPYAPATARIYVFSPNSWSPDSVEKVLERYQR
jgi:hypothetical protein